MVEHQFKPDWKPSAFIMTCMLDALILSELADEVSKRDLKEVTPTLALYYKSNVSRENFENRLYNNIYYQIASPLYHVNYIDPYIPNTFDTRSVIERSAKEHALNEARLTHQYYMNCKEYIENQNVRINPHEYLDEIKNKPTSPRTPLIQRTIKDGSLKGGRNKPKLDFNLHFKDTFNYLHNVSKFESKVYANALAFGKGTDVPYSHKTWIWSHKVKTRHKFMQGQTVPINEPFVVTNERTGEMSNLMFPRDYARDVTGANTINCGCDVDYHNNKDGGMSIW